MDAPEIRYCTTTDGVRIAYTIAGEGPPLLFVTEPTCSHTQFEWSMPLFAAFFRRLASRLTLIRLDVRGTGLSDRVVSNDPFASYALDLDAVIAKLPFDSMAIAAAEGASPFVIPYVHRHPGLATRLVLLDAVVRSADVLDTAQVQAINNAILADWVLGTEIIGVAAFGTGRDESRDFGAYIRQCIGPEYFSAGLQTFDNAGLLPEIDVPTLVLKHADVQYVPTEAAKELAARMPNARLAVLSGGWADDMEGLADRIGSFVVGDQPPAAADESRLGSQGVRTVLFTDIVGHTEMMQRLGDQRGRGVLREYERITRDLLKEHGGAEVKTMGDGFMASFASVTNAMDCAIALQRAFASREGEPLEVRVGLNAGEPIEEDGDLFGSTVIMASRVAARAGAGEILIPEPVRHLLSGKGYVYADRGETMLKGFEDAVRLYEVRWRE